MNKEEAKQWLRSQIDSSVKKQDELDNNVFFLSYNKNYLRALKLSTITGQPVNKENFKGGGHLFSFYKNSKTFWHFPIIGNYLIENYSKNHLKRRKIVEEVMNEYKTYKHYKYW